jgi:ABC-2 type transport system ATP-binding protein
VRGFALKEPTLHDAFIGLTGDNPDQAVTLSEAVQ